MFSIPDPQSLTNKDLLFMSCMLSVFFFLPKISYFFIEGFIRHSTFPISPMSMSLAIPVASSPMTVCLFMRMRVAGPFALITAACTGIILQNRLEMFFYFMLNGLMAAYWIRHCREHKVFIQAGAKLGLLNIVLAAALKLHTGEFISVGFLWDMGFAFMGGIGTGIISTGLVPLIEFAFNYTSDIRLLELSNLERPLLRRLMLEAPGTYHHSVVIGTMVEAAAAEIGANPLLAKVCAYYHDIGKIRKPMYFIENQMRAANRHEKLAPTMSGLILIAHVKDGVDIGRENKLGQPILDAIRQHHGTSLIRYFYEKAKAKGVDTLTIEDFRYPGPKPQTREAGLVMLADVMEASSRTLENPTPSRIQGHVRKIMDSIMTDGQLEECDLTLKDLHKIETVFNKILNGIHHHRIEYSETPEAKDKKNGNSHQQQTRQTPYLVGKNRENGTDTIRLTGTI
jgi:putative nucleotidyltransferase with HDIG domain